MKLRLYCRVKELPDRTVKAKKSDLAVSDSGDESDVGFNR